jgi:hypothetical protein
MKFFPTKKVEPGLETDWVAFDDISVSKMNITKYYYANGQR